jgi:hypothetical protein
MRTVLLAIAVSLTLPWTASRADDTPCEPPAVPTLPFALSGDAHASSLSGVVESVLSEGLDYLACIQAALEKGDLTAEEKQRLETAYETQEAAMRAMAERWNGLYSSHARRKAEK